MHRKYIMPEITELKTEGQYKLLAASLNTEVDNTSPAEEVSYSRRKVDIWEFEDEE